MKKSESIIGKGYVPNDNSYSVNLSYPGRIHRLAGTLNPDEKPKQTKIVTEPYQFAIRTDIHRDDPTLHWFIQVEYKGDIVRVLYQEQNVDVSLESRIEDHNRNRNFHHPYY